MSVLSTDAIKKFWQKIKNWRTTEYYTTNIQGQLAAGAYEYSFTLKNKFGHPMYIAAMGDYNPTITTEWETENYILIEIYKGSELKYGTCSSAIENSTNQLINVMWIDDSPSNGDNSYKITLEVYNNTLDLSEGSSPTGGAYEGLRIVGFEL